MPLVKKLPDEVLNDNALWAIVNRSKTTPMFSWRFDRYWEGPTYLVDLSPDQRLARWFKQHVRHAGLGGECVLMRNGYLLAYARHMYSRNDSGVGMDYRCSEVFITTMYTQCGWLGRLLGYQWRVRTYHTRV